MGDHFSGPRVYGDPAADIADLYALDAARVSALGGPLLAVVGETITSGGHPVRLEHTARAELKNFVMSDSRFDTVNSTAWPRNWPSSSSKTATAMPSWPGPGSERPSTAECWRASAAARYNELALLYPDAFACHAVDFLYIRTGEL